MAWNDPVDWVTNQLVTASDLNEQIRDNLDYLIDRPADQYILDEGFDYTTSSTSFVNIDGTLLSLSLTTSGGDVMIGFVGSFYAASLLDLYLEVTIGGVGVAGNDGILISNLYAGERKAEGFVWVETGVAAGTHTINLQWKVSANTATLYAGAGTTNYDVHPQFWAREV